jgi:hypothetical protein
LRSAGFHFSFSRLELAASCLRLFPTRRESRMKMRTTTPMIAGISSWGIVPVPDAGSGGAA